MTATVDVGADADTGADVTGLGGDCGGPGISGCLSHAAMASTTATPDSPNTGFLQAADNFPNCRRYWLMIALLKS